jgi:dolichyl-diphosphooligosaccharide--protein glycosyltransferase/undecaprenyl-diphosphooligosaccharide--protein glycosyltransferase
MPTIISSLVVVPIILISRLFGKTLWGFLAALLGSIAWSYYNRTKTGYYDTDMFSAMAPMFILYFLIKSTIDFNLRSALYAAIAIVLYPFLYDQGLAIVYAMGIIYGAYMLWYHRDSKVTYKSLLLVFLALLPIGLGAPVKYIVHLLIIAIAYVILNKKEFETIQLMIGSGVVFVAFLLLGNVFGLIIAKIFSYTLTGTSDEGLHFYGVNQTVKEAGHIPFSTFANRISGSILGLWIAAIGYIVLVMRKPVFILALPLVGIGVFANWGGLRFTVYAVPVAAMSAV